MLAMYVCRYAFASQKPNLSMTFVFNVLSFYYSSRLLFLFMVASLFHCSSMYNWFSWLQRSWVGVYAQYSFINLPMSHLFSKSKRKFLGKKWNQYQFALFEQLIICSESAAAMSAILPRRWGFLRAAGENVAEMETTIFFYKLSLLMDWCFYIVSI